MLTTAVERDWQRMLRACHGEFSSPQAPNQQLPADLQGLSTSEAVDTLEQRYAPILSPPIEAPLVIAQLGQSLDGRIATASGHAQFVTSDADRTHLHRLRALCDAVLVGAGTVVADNPQLTVRAVTGPQPRRVVHVSRSGLSAHWRIFADSSAVTWVVAPADVKVPMADDRLTPASESVADIRRALAEAGVRRLLVEGGARTVSAWIAAGLVDYLYLTIAPVIIGAGPTGLQLPAIEHMDEALRPAVTRFAMGPDQLYRLDMTQTPGMLASKQTPP